jgi:hypothetical protein
MADLNTEDQQGRYEQTVIQNIRTTGKELDDEELRLATGAMADPGGGVSYMGGSPGCWGDYDPNVPR